MMKIKFNIKDHEFLEIVNYIVRARWKDEVENAVISDSTLKTTTPEGGTSRSTLHFGPEK